MRKFLAIVILTILWASSAMAFELKPNTWTSDSTTDDITDETRTLATVAAEGGQNDGLIILGCYGGEMFEGKISTGNHLRGKIALVTYRVDKLDPEEFATQVGSGVSYFNEITNPIVQALMGGSKQIVIEIRDGPNYTSSSRAKFTLRNSTSSINKVVKDCSK